MSESLENQEKAAVFFYNDSGSDNPWNALNGAQAWLREHGYSYGPMQRGAPIAAFKGDCEVSKWRNLGADRTEADAVIESMNETGTYRYSDVMLIFKPASNPHEEEV